MRKGVDVYVRRLAVPVRSTRSRYDPTLSVEPSHGSCWARAVAPTSATRASGNIPRARLRTDCIIVRLEERSPALLVAQAHDGILARGAPSGDDAEDHANGDGHAKGDDNRERRDD